LREQAVSGQKGFGADLLEALTAAAELINTGRSAGGDELRTAADVASFARRYGMGGRAREGDVAALRAYRARLDAIVTACEAGNGPAGGTVNNALVRGAGGHPADGGARRARPAYSRARARRADGRPDRRPPRHGPGRTPGGRGERPVAHLRVTGLPRGLSGRVPKPVPALLRQPYLREPAARRRLSGPQGRRGVTPPRSRGRAPRARRPGRAARPGPPVRRSAGAPGGRGGGPTSTGPRRAAASGTGSTGRPAGPAPGARSACRRRCPRRRSWGSSPLPGPRSWCAGPAPGR